MELHAFDFVAAVTEAHDDAVVGLGSDCQFARQGFFFDDERVVARRGEGIRQLAENTLAIVMDLAGFAVKEFWSADDFPSKRSANGLMTEAHAKDRKFPGEALDELHGNACLLRRARPRRNYDSFGLAADNSFHGNLVVAVRSEEHTSELQSHHDLVCRLLLEKKNAIHNSRHRDSKTDRPHGRS